MLTQLFPFSSVEQTDPETGVADSLHHRLDARGSPLRVFYTNTSAEYHRGDASLIHTDPDGKVDVDPGPNVRVYHFTGDRARRRHVAANGYVRFRRRHKPDPEHAEHDRLHSTAPGVPGEFGQVGSRGRPSRRRAAIPRSKTERPSHRPV